MINNDWDFILKDVFESKEFTDIMNKVNNEYQKYKCYPLYHNIFNCFRLTSYENTKVVILGQDPYHGANQAHGLAFSVQLGNEMPPSLRNIFKELYSDLNIKNETTDLTKWAKEGVLLLNTILTVREKEALSHENIGWEYFIDNILIKLNNKKDPVVFILWGKKAQEKERFITNKKHLIIKSAHPSPFSADRGFFNSKPFSKTNDFLNKNKIKEIDFRLY